MSLNESFLQELKYKTDIEDIVSTYVSLRKRGNTSVGLCPFHNEKTPSFTVYNDTQSFYCFGCGAGGDAIGFIKKLKILIILMPLSSLPNVQVCKCRRMALMTVYQKREDEFCRLIGKRQNFFILI